MRNINRQGFTLIELSIVLVIIGLIVGGVLVGRDLIAAAQIRAQISQIEKYKTAVNTFMLKYNALPGDIQASQAVAIGFIPRTGGVGDGDGNGLVEGLGGSARDSDMAFGGETVFFWTDLSSANLIDGGFSDATDTWITTTPDQTYKYLPTAKIGNAASIMVFNNVLSSVGAIPGYSGLDFEIGNPTVINAGTVDVYNGVISVIATQNIDNKIDDGLPMSGRVVSAQLGCMPPACVGGAAQIGWITNGGNFGNTAGYCVNNATTPFTYNTKFADYPACNLIFAGQ